MSELLWKCPRCPQRLNHEYVYRDCLDYSDDYDEDDYGPEPDEHWWWSNGFWCLSEDYDTIAEHHIGVHDGALTADSVANKLCS